MKKSYFVPLALMVSLFSHGNEVPVSAASYQLEGKVTIASGALNVRKSHSTQSAIIGKLSKGAVVSVTEEKNGWYEVQSPNGEGWVSSSYITVTKKAATAVPVSSAAATKAGTVKVSGALNMRSAGTATASVIAKLTNGTSVSILSEANGWYKVTANGKTGWVSAGYVTVKAETPTASVPSVTDTKTGTVKVSGALNMRSAGTATASVVAKLTNGTSVSILSEANGWYKVTANGKTGWVSTGYVVLKTNEKEVASPISNTATYEVQAGDTLWSIATKFSMTADQLKKLNNLNGNAIYSGKILTVSGEKETSNAETEKTYLKSTVSGLNVRSNSSTSSSIVGKLSSGDVVEVLNQKTGWYHIQKGTLTGWASASYLVKTTDTSSEPAPSKQLAGVVIIVDPGHGGDDPGALGVDGYTYEHHLNMIFSNKIKQALQSKGATVHLTRGSNQSCGNLLKNTKDDKEMACRVAFTNTYEADLFISVHSNSYYNSLPRGIETYYSTKSDITEKSLLLANEVHSKVKQTVSTPDRKVKPSGVYYVLRKNTTPSILLEIAFVSNLYDLNQLKSTSVQTNYAQKLTEGVITYIEKTK